MMLGVPDPKFSRKMKRSKKNYQIAMENPSILGCYLHEKKPERFGGFVMAMLVYRRVCKIRMFPKIVGFPPKSSIFIGFFHYGPSILGVPLFSETPIQDLSVGEDLPPSQDAGWSPIRMTVLSLP